MTIHADIQIINREKFINSKTADDLTSWESELQKIDKALSQLLKDIELDNKSIQENKNEKHNLDIDFSLDGITKRVDRVIILEKTIQALEYRQRILEGQRDKLKLEISSKESDIRELRIHLQTEARTQEIEQWIDDIFMPNQETYSALREELKQKLDSHHYLKNDGGILKQLGQSQRLSKFRERHYRLLP